MTRRIFTLANSRLRDRAIECIRDAVPMARVEIKGPKRGDSQNSAMWPMLGDVSEQLSWEGLKLDTEEWKLVFLDALRREHRDQMKLVPNTDRTGFVDISGKSSSDLSHEEIRDLLTIIRAFGDQHQVEWSEAKNPKDRRPAPPIEAYEDQDPFTRGQGAADSGATPKAPGDLNVHEAAEWFAGYDQTAGEH